MRNFLLLFGFILSFLSMELFAQPLSGILPKHLEYESSQTPFFSWNDLSGATDYSVILSQDPTFSSGLVQSPLLSISSWTSSTLAFGKWYWKVMANSPLGNMQSNVYTLTIYDPLQNSNLSLWLKADAGVVLDGSSKVQSWTDLSSNGFVFNQLSAVKRPVVNSSILNSFPAIHFQGAQVLNGGDILDLGLSSRSMFIVGNHTVTNTGYFYAKAKLDASNSRYGMSFRNNNDIRSLYVDVLDRTATGITTRFSSQFSVLEQNVNRSTHQNRLIQSGNVLSSTNGISTTHNMNSSFRFLLGAYNDASDVGEVSFLNGNICEIVFVDTADSLETIKVQEYLHYKYAPPVNLGKDTTINHFCSINLTAPSGFTNLLWSTGATSASISVSQPGLYWLRGTDQLGFITYDTIQVNQPEIPTPTITGICIGNSIIWNADLGPGFNYLWSPNGEITPSINITTPGTYSVQVTDGLMCTRNSGNITFTIDTYSQTAFLGADTSLCIDNLIALQVGASETISYLWPDASNGIDYEVDTTGNYFVETVNVNGCVAQDTIHITITGQAPIANFSFQNQCIGLENSFLDLSVGIPTDPIAFWEWNLGDSNSDITQNPTHTYSSTGTYTVQLYIESTGGCGAFHTEEVSIYALPTANFTDVGHCSGQSVQFTNTSTFGDAPLSDYLWTFDQPWLGELDTSILVSPVSTFDAAGNYNISLEVTDTNGCKDTLIVPIIIDQSPIVAFTASDECANAPITFTNSSVALLPATYFWDFGDLTSSILPIPVKNYETIGIHTINLTVTASNECFNTLQQQINVHPNPVAVIDVGPMCMGTYTSLTDNSNIASGSIASSLWILNTTDTVIGLSNVFEFNSLGQQQVVLETTSNFGCTSTESQFFDITESLEASFTTSSAITAVGEPIIFTNTTSGLSNVSWDFGDGNNLNFVSPTTHIYDANYLDSIVTVSMIASNVSGCIDTAQVSIEIRIPILDLETTNILVQDNGSLWIIGVELKNVGSITVKKANLQVQLPDGPVIVELWNGNLIPGQTEIYVFNSLINEYIPMDTTETFVCVESVGYDINNNTEVYLDNNKACKNIDGVDVLLLPIYPNPANNNLTIELLVTIDSDVSLEIIDSKGRIIKSILSTQTLDAGFYSYDVDISQIQSGYYFLRMKSGDEYSSYELLITNY